MNGEMVKADSQKEMDTASTMINELQVNQNEDLEGLINYTESAHIESEWTVEDGFLTAPVSFCSATVCNNTLKPWDEIKKTWQMWEGRPITFEHPDEMVVKNPTDIIGFLGNVEKEVVRNKGAEPGDHIKRPDTLTDWLNKILDKAEVETRDGFRAGRRRFGRDLYKATGYEIRSVSQYFGHSDPRETLKYLQLDEFDQREKIDQLDEMLENLHYPEREKEIVKTSVKMKAGPEEEKRPVSVQPNQAL